MVALWVGRDQLQALGETVAGRVIFQRRKRDGLKMLERPASSEMRRKRGAFAIEPYC